MNDLTFSRLKNLKISGIIKTLDLRNEEVLTNNIYFIEFFELLLNDEVINRQTDANKKHIHKVCFQFYKTPE